MKKLLFPFLIIALLFACSSEKEVEFHSVVDKLENMHYAELTIGDTAHSVINSFLDSLLISNNQELVFSAKTKDKRIQKREIRTALDRDLIYEISIDFYLAEDSLVSPFFNECKTKLDQLYGESKMDDGYAAWNSSSVHNKVIEIELFDESINSNLTMVSVNFYEDFDKSFYAE